MRNLFYITMADLMTGFACVILLIASPKSSVHERPRPQQWNIHPESKAAGEPIAVYSVEEDVWTVRVYEYLGNFDAELYCLDDRIAIWKDHEWHVGQIEDPWTQMLLPDDLVGAFRLDHDACKSHVVDVIYRRHVQARVSWMRPPPDRFIMTVPRELFGVDDASE